jgi:2,3-bisphosphoglycerate-independent phosphoglycerate mutase
MKKDQVIKQRACMKILKQTTGDRQPATTTEGRNFKKVVLMILDGWGISNNKTGNAIALASKPNMDALMKQYPVARLHCSGEAVGLPEGQMGNSEVGHLNIGAGRVVYQDFARIDKSIRDGDFFNNPQLLSAIDHALVVGGALHLVGLLSDGGVHSHIRHIYALLKMAEKKGLNRVFVHALLDGRDVPPASAIQYIDQLEQKMAVLGVGRIATVMGRYYAMDRDKRWERVSRAYNAMVKGEGLTAGSAQGAVERSYERGEMDEFVQPTVILDNAGCFTGKVSDNDSMIFFNFRPDRAREISHAFVDKDFACFDRQYVKNLCYVCMTQYDETIAAPVAYPPQDVRNTLAEYLSRNGFRQLHIAETEKYAHVTFFFNGGVEEPYPGEERVLIPSPKVATYDLKPEMSAYEITDMLVSLLEEHKYDFVVLNFANPDMVGHTGILEAAIKAVEAVDDCIGRVVKAASGNGYIPIITADHGNAEKMLDEESDQPFTAHTTYDVPFIIIDDERKSLRSEGILADIAPTILDLMGLPVPPEMTGKSMIERSF